MKKTLKSLLILTTIISFFSCDKDETKNPEAKISSFIIEEVEGVIDENAKTISLSLPVGVDLNGVVPDIEFSKKAVITPAADEAQDFTSNVQYTLISEDESTTVTYTVIVTTNVTTSANCGVVKPNQILNFTFENAIAFWDGSSASIGGQNDANYVAALQTGEGLSAEVVWYTEDNVTKLESNPLKVEIVKNSLKVIAGDKLSNALVSIKFGDNVLWSYHVWTSDVNLSEMAQSVDGAIWMDRNIGALSKDDQMKALGLYFQWGRKEPIVVNSDDSKNNYAEEKNGVSVVKAVQNPDLFFAGDNEDANWCNADPIIDELWSPETKSIFDPSPEGYKVPANDNAQWDQAIYNMEPQENEFFTFYNKAVYPVSPGYIYGRYGMYDGCEGSYWSSSVAPENMVYVLLFYSFEDMGDWKPYLNNTSLMGRSNGYLVRSIKE